MVEVTKSSHLEPQCIQTTGEDGVEVTVGNEKNILYIDVSRENKLKAVVRM